MLVETERDEEMNNGKRRTSGGKRPNVVGESMGFTVQLQNCRQRLEEITLQSIKQQSGGHMLVKAQDHKVDKEALLENTSKSSRLIIPADLRGYQKCSPFTQVIESKQSEVERTDRVVHTIIQTPASAPTWPW